MAMFASSELLVSVFRGDRIRTQRVLSRVGTATTLLGFLVSPLNGALMDSVGRRPFLICGSSVSAAIRLFISIRPSVEVRRVRSNVT